MEEGLIPLVPGRETSTLTVADLAPGDVLYAPDLKSRCLAVVLRVVDIRPWTDADDMASDSALLEAWCIVLDSWEDMAIVSRIQEPDVFDWKQVPQESVVRWKKKKSVRWNTLVALAPYIFACFPENRTTFAYGLIKRGPS